MGQTGSCQGWGKEELNKRRRKYQQNIIYAELMDTNINAVLTTRKMDGDWVEMGKGR